MTPYVPMFNQPPIRVADASEEAPAAVGFPSPAEPFAEKVLNLNARLIKHPAATFFLSAKGDALLEAGIRHGDLLIVDRSLESAPGRVVIAVVDGEFTVQYFERLKKNPAPKNQPNGSKSRSDNPFEIWGVVTYVIHPL
ncbi:MAG TPA: translesion error-prone DNA polymerase V autoproteolytic subunit [Verrucomicrobiae bacterium]|nr:translesion error-prone DNA polymerase V autoproteolytic subunit [Verrucomicrobiae bacterium]